MRLTFSNPESFYFDFKKIRITPTFKGVEFIRNLLKLSKIYDRNLELQEWQEECDKKELLKGSIWEDSCLLQQHRLLTGQYILLDLNHLN